MELTKERAKENLAKLVEKFERESSASRIKEYNEEATKTAFIQPLLKDVLGWDVNDRNEVSPEERISRGRVDYGVKVEGKIKFYIEAKPPKAELSKHIEQAVRYGYNRKGVPFVLLTDFEELKLFDVTVKPDVRNPRKGLKIDLRWNQYLSEFDNLWLLSKRSIVQGELDKLLLVKPKERLPVDKAILDDLKRWREILAKDIFKNNHRLFQSGDREKDADYLKEITQRILDRIIFMRSCEDRGLIHRPPLEELFEERTETVGTNTIVFLKEEFKHYNIIFDSDLFRPKDWEGNLAVDFKVVRNIVLDSYNPYQFDVIPLEVLGNIYEQYLGYTIRLTDHQVKYELKPEVRKAGGVYYTPEYIVDYIVKNTVGKLLQELPPKKITKLRILDPACGSGSFLIRAYEEMLNYYKNEKKQRRKSVERQEKLDLKQELESRLTIQEKSAILRGHIFGVDIDEQAVEVTKLSLMLKMLEGEYGIIPGRAILPMLDKNIKCGNSLISGDTLELQKYFGDEWYKVKSFKRDEEFRKIMVEEGGFDAVVGNPPYIAFQEGSKSVKKYYRENYKSAIGKYDLYILFVEKSISILKSTGFFGFIIPNKFIHSDYGAGIKDVILKNQVIEIVDFNDIQVFTNATNYPCILIIRKSTSPSIFEYKTVHKIHNSEIMSDSIAIDQKFLSNSAWLLIDHAEETLLTKIKNNKPKLGLISLAITQGLRTGSLEVFFNNINRAFINKSKIESKIVKPVFHGKNVKRYTHLLDEVQDLILFPYEDDFRTPINIDKFPNGRDYLLQYKNELKERRDSGKIFKDTNKLWFEYWDSKPICFKSPKIIFPDISNQNNFYLDLDGIGYLNTCYGIILKEALNYQYILGILNSKVIEYFIKKISPFVRGGYYRYKTKYIEQLPIRTINFSNKSEKKLHDELISLVNIMLNLNKKIQTARGNEKEQIQRQIEKTDREIDEIVYKLYGITEEEKKIIESKE